MQYLSKYEALIICFLLSGFFVGSLYFFNRKRQLELTRDHPEVIKKRFISILIVCIVSPFALIIYYYIRNVFDNVSFFFFFFFFFKKKIFISYINAIIINNNNIIIIMFYMLFPFLKYYKIFK